MISHPHKAIFIHIHKTAGTSIEKKMGLFDQVSRGVQDHRKLREIERISSRKKNLKSAIKKISKGEISQSFNSMRHVMMPEINRDQYESYFKFSFVRNTWARMYSWYKNVMKDEVHQIRLGIEPTMTFHEFLIYYSKRKQFAQIEFLKNANGNVAVDFIGRFERLQKDFDTVCDHIGIEDSSLPHMLSSKSSDYREAYDQKDKDLVYHTFHEEIKYFGFEFGE